MSEWREGDVFFWRYKGPCDRMTHWACACKAVVRDGRLVDTYWHGNSNKSWSFAEAKKAMVLEYKGNLCDFEKVSDYLIEYYDESDTLDMRHANSTRNECYVKKGSARSKEKMLQLCRYRREKAEFDLRSAQHNIDRYAQIEAKIEAGDSLAEIWL